jgi:hypothetical protein
MTWWQRLNRCHESGLSPNPSQAEGVLDFTSALAKEGMVPGTTSNSDAERSHEGTRRAWRKALAWTSAAAGDPAGAPWSEGVCCDVCCVRTRVRAAGLGGVSKYTRFQSSRRIEAGQPANGWIYVDERRYRRGYSWYPWGAIDNFPGYNRGYLKVIRSQWDI